MIITVFGATGMVGQQLVKQALYMGYSVKAFGRNVFTAQLPDISKLELVQGALFDEKEVRNAIRGSDAVVSALGGAIDGSDKTRSLGMKNIVGQMDKAGVNRIVAIGGLGVLPDDTGKLLMDDTDYPAEYLNVANEHLKAYRTLKSSTLEWTFVCPPDIRNAEVTGLYNTAAETLPPDNKNYINSGDLAMFMLNELTQNKYIRQRVGISN